VIERAPNVILWSELLDTWRTLTAIMPNYESEGEGYQSLAAARRTVEVEMKAQGYASEWSRLTHARPTARKGAA